MGWGDDYVLGEQDGSAASHGPGDRMDEGEPACEVLQDDFLGHDKVIILRELL